jgi:hypothetical protein
MKTLKLLAACLVVALFISSCAKDGAPGATGPAGPTGAAGSAGTNGVANITTTVFTVAPANWFIYAANIFMVDESVPTLTDSINDAVIVTVSRTVAPFAGEYFGLPMNNFLASNDEIDYIYGLKHILIGYNFTSAPAQTLKIKVAVIPPAVMQRHPGVNWKNNLEAMAVPEVQQALNKE